MLEQIVKTAYKEFTLRFYHELFARFQDQETGLTAAEIYAAEAIRALGSPTVNEFADFMHVSTRSEEHTSELQSRFDLVCRLLLEKKKKNANISAYRH